MYNDAVICHTATTNTVTKLTALSDNTEAENGAKVKVLQQ